MEEGFRPLSNLPSTVSVVLYWDKTYTLRALAVLHLLDAGEFYQPRKTCRAGLLTR